MKKFNIFLFLFIFCISCSETGEPGKEKNLNDHLGVEALKNAIEIRDSVKDEREDLEIKFEQSQVYGTTDEIIVGNISSFTVDSLSRVLLADRSQTRIHVFQYDGTFLTSIGRQGKGPAEFAAISPNTIITEYGNQLFVPNYANSYNFFPNSVQVFSLEDLSFSHTVNVVAENRNEYEDELDGYFPVRAFPRNDGNFVIAYRRMPNEYKDDDSYIRYFIQSGKARILSGPILEQKDLKYLTHEVLNVEMPYTALQTFSFLGKSLFAMSDDGFMFTARTEEFTIDALDPDGNHVRTISHSIKPVNLNRRELVKRYEQQKSSPLGEGVLSAMIKNTDQIPDVWPVLNDLLIDDENRLWVSTIVEDFEIYEWWVLKETGEVITKFEWPRVKLIKEIRNSAVYTLETEEETGLQQVVRYGFKLEAW